MKRQWIRRLDEEFVTTASRPVKAVDDLPVGSKPRYWDCVCEMKNVRYRIGPAAGHSFGFFFAVIAVSVGSSVDATTPPPPSVSPPAGVSAGSQLLSQPLGCRYSPRHVAAIAYVGTTVTNTACICAVPIAGATAVT